MNNFALKTWLTCLVLSIICIVPAAHAQLFYSVPALSERLGLCTLDCGHWYVGGGVGISHLFDEKAPGSVNSVDQNGPGWNFNIGYQFNAILGAEAGYIQYHASRETVGAVVGSITVATTEHYAAYLALTGKYPLADRFSILGKLGAAYSYANKIFTTGPSASSGAVSPFYGIGLVYCVTPRYDLNLLWTRVRGNHLTGSSDLYSVGFTMALV